MLDKVRVYEIAEEAGVTSSEVIEKAKDLGIKLYSPQSATTYEEAEELVNYVMTGKSKFLPSNIQKHDKTKPLMDNQSNKNLSSEINNFTIELFDLKKIKTLKITIAIKKGLYAFIGDNAVGKSSLITCLAKLVEPSSIIKEFKGKNSYKHTKIVYKFNNREIIWEKRHTWECTTNNKELMPKFQGVYEASLISGNRFEHIRNKNRDIGKAKITNAVKINDFVIKNLEYIIYGKVNGIFATLKILNDVYFIEKDYDYITEFYFSAGEYFLLSILKFIDNFRTKRISEKPGIIIIDEVEIALHPLAQKRLVEKFSEFQEEYNIMVIFATHSVQIIEHLKAENMFYLENQDGICKITNPIYPGYLTSRLYKYTFFDKVVLVEDELTEKFLRYLLKDIDVKLLYTVLPIGSWEKVLEIHELNHRKSLFLNAKILSVLDGDIIDKANVSKYSTLMKIFLPLQNIERYTVETVYYDDTFVNKIEMHYLSPKKLIELNIDIKTNNTDAVKQSYKYGIIREIAKASKQSDGNIESFIIEFIHQKLMSENDNEYIKFKDNFRKFFM